MKLGFAPVFYFLIVWLCTNSLFITYFSEKIVINIGE